MFTHKNLKQVVVCDLMLLNIKQEIIISQGFRIIDALKRLTLESMLGKMHIISKNTVMRIK